MQGFLNLRISIETDWQSSTFYDRMGGLLFQDGSWKWRPKPDVPIITAWNMIGMRFERLVRTLWSWRVLPCAIVASVCNSRCQPKPEAVYYGTRWKNGISFQYSSRKISQFLLVFLDKTSISEPNYTCDVSNFATHCIPFNSRALYPSLKTFWHTERSIWVKIWLQSNNFACGE